MRLRPQVVAFDIIETVFSLDLLRERLTAVGLPGHALETWFAASLRDAFALAAVDQFKPFREVLEGTLSEMFTRYGSGATSGEKKTILDGFGELNPHPDAAEAFRILTGAGVRIFALSNGAAASTTKLLRNAGLDGSVEKVLSVDDVKLSKPRREVYRHAVSVAGVEPGRMVLVAVHPWDVNGAKAAGLLGGFVARGQAFPPTMAEPDICGETLVDVARAIVG